jgi:hypothetical protein
MDLIAEDSIDKRVVWISVGKKKWVKGVCNAYFIDDGRLGQLFIKAPTAKY